MARGSGAGTGVIVALVVSVVCVIGLLTLTFMMYAGKMEKIRERNEATLALENFVKSEEKNNDAAARLFASADAADMSVFKYLNERNKSVSSFVCGNPSATIDEMQSQLGVAEGDTAKSEIIHLRQQLQASTNEIQSLKRQLDDIQQDNNQLVSRAEQAESDSEVQVASVTQTFAGYSDASVEYQNQVEDAVSAINDSRQKLDRDHRNAIAEVRGHLDQARHENKLNEGVIEELRKKTENYRIKPQSPAELVDGRVISVPGSDGELFIDLGRNDRVMPGMTFEVYNNSTSIRVDTRSGDYTRGKASIEIIRVGPETSTARITRAAQGRPVVKDDVIANAVFNPEYRFKFLVHGLFDVNDDGRPSNSEADYVRRRIIDWGGQLIEGNKLTGDLDFLVLGSQPPMPAPLPPDAEDVEFRSYLQQRESREQYDRLFEQASKAQIPVLNWNRFEVLTGMGS